MLVLNDKCHFRGGKVKWQDLAESLTWLMLSLRSAAESRGAGNPTYSHGIVPEKLDVVRPERSRHWWEEGLGQLLEG